MSGGAPALCCFPKQGVRTLFRQDDLLDADFIHEQIVLRIAGVEADEQCQALDARRDAEQRKHQGTFLITSTDRSCYEDIDTHDGAMLDWEYAKDSEDIPACGLLPPDESGAESVGDPDR